VPNKSERRDAGFKVPDHDSAVVGAADNLV